MNNILDKFPRKQIVHAPTPLEHMPNLSKHFGDYNLYVKRDDCTGLGMGGNKARQLEFYFGEALAQGCDTILITGAVQSNYMRMAAAFARKCGMDCHLQLEDRVPDKPAEYHNSGNVTLYKVFGATLHHYPDGEDEEGADKQLKEIADSLVNQGKNPYIIPLTLSETPKGALGYVAAAFELDQQFKEQKLNPAAIIVASGSSYTHTGLLTGLRLVDNQVPVIGACVRRDAVQQKSRVHQCAQYLCNNLLDTNGDLKTLIDDVDVLVEDFCLDGGYGKITDQTKHAIQLLAHNEGLLSDPVYSGKAFACAFGLIEQGRFKQGDDIVIIHTGGTPALFAYNSIF
ncbi:D-cysteine desulfhydrase family protein [Cocleimonas sp. KMM 6892]|uniref:D-cysteine desulfhydrase family protein n=1 Tax=unclassified Cocleimonas TaxID=2639732 RepID=UPI002DBBF9F8|nr:MULTISPECIES: D-cysteine desulfhydrase family protein [unclassified Cocleimonas]MEB8432822.1 D-cysteine desulfhydrase family protein [Cocleimonas sp. KMM 6892]MEC4715681.1 D-cysteine desulfhydrase family protein [Cocleimonas sp. KMM 6895]MEC4744701.1 D-cysteine desulfhydrase family protein [Cocleimonas sp. KMM 6896]